MRRCLAKLEDWDNGQHNNAGGEQETNIGEPLATSFMLTSVRLFTGVGTYVDGEGATLDKALVTVTPSADVRTVIGVYAVVSDEVGLAIELLELTADQSVQGEG